MSQITPAYRAEVLLNALEIANVDLGERALEVAFLRQWPLKRTDLPQQCLKSLDERPDIELQMKTYRDRWFPIDIVYMRQMPQEPENLKTVPMLAQDIFAKAMGHLEAMRNPDIYISSSGSKIDLSHVDSHEFQIDEEEYFRVHGMRLVYKNQHGFSPIKASDVRSHTIMKVLKFSENAFILTDEFDQIRTDGKTGIYCYLDKTVILSKKHLVLERQEEAESYEKEMGTRYILIQRTRDFQQ